MRGSQGEREASCEHSVLLTGQQTWGTCPGMQETLLLLLVPCVTVDKWLCFRLSWGTAAFPGALQVSAGPRSRGFVLFWMLSCIPTAQFSVSFGWPPSAQEVVGCGTAGQCH